MYPARILVQNGTTTPGLAADCAAHLSAQGFTIGNITAAPREDYAQTLILVYTGHHAAAQALAAALGVNPAAITYGSSPEGPYDIKIILGADYTPPPD
jgi:hypothetical protein